MAGAVMCASTTSRNFASHAGCAGHAGPVTRLPSTTASVMRDLHIRSAGQPHFRRAGGIAIHPATLEHARSRKNLRTVAQRGNRLPCPVEMAHDVEHLVIQAEILRRAAAGHHEAVVVFRADLIERGIQREIVAALFGVGLIALEVVDGGAHLFALLFPGANCVDAVADHLQGLERNHDLVVFNKIAGEQQQLCRFHRIHLQWNDFGMPARTFARRERTANSHLMALR